VSHFTEIFLSVDNFERSVRVPLADVACFEIFEPVDFGVIFRGLFRHLEITSGEYVALGKVEAALKTSAAIANVVVYGSGAILMPIAIACPVEKVVLDWAKELGVEGDLVEICKDDKINKKMMEELQATAKAANLSKLEIPNKIHIDGNFDAGWLPDTGLVTDAFKLKRKQLNDHYADVITKLTA
jgi:long-chain acyl-CoA synthetase